MWGSKQPKMYRHFKPLRKIILISENSKLQLIQLYECQYDLTKYEQTIFKKLILTNFLSHLLTLRMESKMSIFSNKHFGTV